MRSPAIGLRAQILLGLALVTLFAVLSTGYLALWAAGTSLREQRESTVLALATTAAAAVAAVRLDDQPLEALDRTRLREALNEIAARTDGLEVGVLDGRGALLLSVPPRVAGDVDPPLVRLVLGGVSGVFQYRSRPGSGEMELLAYAPIARGTRVFGAARVAVPAPVPLELVLQRSGWLLLALAVGDALLVLGLGYFVLTRLVVRPLQTMEQATARVSAGDWEQRIAPSGPREVAALASAFNDMTASLAAQREQLIRTEKLASIGQLAAGVAHEIGNPLAAILGYVDILRLEGSGPGGLSPEDRRDALDRVKAETQRIHRIIQDLLAYSRPTREEAEPTQARTVLATSLALLGPQARFRRVVVAADPPAENAWPEVLASPGRLTQVFVNLLLNAADAMGGQGQITVSCRADGDRVHLTFADQGPGVPVDVRRKIFDPFFTTKGPGQGTGLGLSISRAIVEGQGGTLELADAPAGAAFVVTLPAAPPAGVTG